MMEITSEDQRAFMQRRDLSASSLSSLSSYISWESIKEFTYKTWSQAKDWMFGDLGESKDSSDTSPQTQIQTQTQTIADREFSLESISINSSIDSAINSSGPYSFSFASGFFISFTKRSDSRDYNDAFF